MIKAPRKRAARGTKTAAAHEQDSEQILADDAATRKRYRSIRAAAAERGIQVVALGPEGFGVVRWGLMRALPDLDAVEAFLAQMGVGA